MPRVLVIDDDPEIREMVVLQLQNKGYEAGMAGTIREGLSKAEEDGWDVILLDVWLPDGNGLEFIPRFTGSRSRPEVLIITGDSTPDGAEAAIRSGAWNYIDKTRLSSDLNLLLPRILEYRVEKQRATAAPVALRRRDIVGSSAALEHCLDELARAAASEVNVLIGGETGTGKEVFARAVHENSGRAEHPFVVVDCATMSENLIESTLFGHVRGAFTGAERTHSGLIKQADRGTLFLDEVKLPLSMQKSFLRVLQERRYRPLGSSTEETSDFRLVSATNRNLEEMVAQGLFRMDLYHRLKGLTLRLPALRDRKEDIPDLVTHFMAGICRRSKQETKGLSPDFIEGLSAYDWPGNVRELLQTMEHILAGSNGAPTLYSVHLPDFFRVKMAKAALENAGQSSRNGTENMDDAKLPSWRDYKHSIEKDYVEKLMIRCSGNIQKACRLSGLSRTRLYQMLNKHDIKVS